MLNVEGILIIIEKRSNAVKRYVAQMFSLFSRPFYHLEKKPVQMTAYKMKTLGYLVKNDRYNFIFIHG